MPVHGTKDDTDWSHSSLHMKPLVAGHLLELGIVSMLILTSFMIPITCLMFFWLDLEIITKGPYDGEYDIQDG